MELILLVVVVALGIALAPFILPFLGWCLGISLAGWAVYWAVRLTHGFLSFVFYLPCLALFDEQKAVELGKEAGTLAIIFVCVVFVLALFDL
jgi:hypothetical protein